MISNFLRGDFTFVCVEGLYIVYSEFGVGVISVKLEMEISKISFTEDRHNCYIQLLILIYKPF